MSRKSIVVPLKLNLAIVLQCFCVASLFTVADAQSAGTLQPNDTLVLRSSEMPNPPDGTSDDCFRFLLGVCQTDRSGESVGARTAGVLPFERGQASISTYYDFKIDDAGGAFETVLNAQISGKGEFNGFLALVAGGEAKGSLDVTLIDLGPSDLAGTIDEQVVFQKSLAKHHLQGTVTTGINFGITVEGGAPYVGIGASPELKFNIKLQKKVVRDSINFGIQALVKRGHTYRVQFDLTSLAKRGATTGTVVSQFQQGGPVIDLLDTENWLSGVRETVSAGLPNLKPESMRIKEGLGWLRNKRMIEAEVVDSEGNSSVLNGSAQYLRQFAPADMPKSFADIVSRRFRQQIPDAVEEGIDRPGFRLDELAVMLEPDHVEIAADQTDRINEAIRLLLTPQGQRNSTYIDCGTGPGNSGNNGNAGNNGNGNGSGCDFPSTPAGTGTGSATVPSANTSGTSGVTSNAAPSASAPHQQSGPSGGGAITWIGLMGLLLIAANRIWT